MRRVICVQAHILLIANLVFISNCAVPETLLVPVNCTTTAKCGCGKIRDLDRAKKGDFPWLVSLVHKNDIGNDPLCWGSLICDKYVLSSAHCTSKYSSLEVEVLLASSVTQQNRRREVASIKNHSGFIIGNQTYDNDISLIKLRQPLDLELGDVTVVCLPPIPPPYYETNETKLNFKMRSRECDYVENPEDLTATMSVFKGFQNVNNRKTHQFDKLSLHSLKNESCSKLYNNRIKAQSLCAEVIGELGSVKLQNKDVGRCIGDSGAPLIYLRKMKNSCDADYNQNSESDSMKVRFLQIGILSNQNECGSNRHHPILLFTRISRYISWIKQNTEDGTYCINSP